MQKSDVPFFNTEPSTVLHIDINSCFATIEQQANPKLREIPIAVAAYTTPSGCILAPSIEAKKLGIRVGMRVKEGKAICPSLIVLSPDPEKYRCVHKRMKRLLERYTDRVIPKSIDEFVLHLKDSPFHSRALVDIAHEIKGRIRKEIGEYLRVSIGISTNRFLAKLASNIQKPDGLSVIDKDTFFSTYERLELTKLPGIKARNAIRLQTMGIFTVVDFYHSPIWKLKAAFSSILGYYWYQRLHGFEVDDVEYMRKSFGNSYSLPKPFSKQKDLIPLLIKLVEKTSTRMRENGFWAKGVHLGISYRDGSYWHKGMSTDRYLFDSRDIFKVVHTLLQESPFLSPVRELSVSCFSLTSTKYTQTHMLDDVLRKEKLNIAIDTLKEKYGDFVITPARMMRMDDIILDRIAFGNVRELQNTADL